MARVESPPEVQGNVACLLPRAFIVTRIAMPAHQIMESPLGTRPFPAYEGQHLTIHYSLRCEKKIAASARWQRLCLGRSDRIGIPSPDLGEIEVAARLATLGGPVRVAKLCKIIEIALLHRREAEEGGSRRFLMIVSGTAKTAGLRSEPDVSEPHLDAAGFFLPNRKRYFDVRCERSDGAAPPSCPTASYAGN
mmetsp:Transcript_32163/g.74006  ORF Transcript_32163/g.74006 Transcript_32163/m.74006 type:complete len:193 (+) Transcript_32163:342-920(+)